MNYFKRKYFTILILIIFIVLISTIVNASAEKTYNLLLKNIEKGDISRVNYWRETLMSDFPNSQETKKAKLLKYPILLVELEVYDSLFRGTYYNDNISFNHINEFSKQYIYTKSKLFKEIDYNFINDFNIENKYRFISQVEPPIKPTNVTINKAYYNLFKTSSVKTLKNYKEIAVKYYLNKWITIFKNLGKENKEDRVIPLIKTAELLNENILIRDKDLEIDLKLYKKFSKEPEKSGGKRSIKEGLNIDMSRLKTIILLLDIALNNTPKYSDQKLDILEIKKTVTNKYNKINGHYNKIKIMDKK